VLFLRSTWIKLNREVIVIILLIRKIQDGCGTGEIRYLDHITIWNNWIISLIDIKKIITRFEWYVPVSLLSVNDRENGMWNHSGFRI
jgi:hypothetical protein